jgi:DUF4097 and DUF4098 domain-containing protein YvlB
MKAEFVHQKEVFLKSSRLLFQYIAGIIFTLAVFTACGGGNDINFNFEGNNWPWPWTNNSDFFVNKAFSQNMEVSDNMNLWLDGVNGEIKITGQPDGDSLIISAMARVGSDTYEDAQAGLEQLEISVKDEDGVITVQTVQPNSTLGRQYVVDYTITIPSDLTVNVSQVNGHVTIQDINNSVSVVLTNGHVDFSEIFGDVTVSVDNGSINGNLILPADGEVVISTVNGDIDLDIPTSTSAEVFGLVSNGTIGWDNLDLVDAKQTNKSLQGKLGDGAGLIDLKTVNGYINIVGFSL